MKNKIIILYRPDFNNMKVDCIDTSNLNIIVEKGKIYSRVSKYEGNYTEDTLLGSYYLTYDKAYDILFKHIEDNQNYLLEQINELKTEYLEYENNLHKLEANKYLYENQK